MSADVRGATEAGFGAAEEALLPHLPDGLADSLYETDASGLPRAMRLLPDTSRPYRRRLAKLARRWMRELSDHYRESLDDLPVVMWFLESRAISGSTFWVNAETERRGGEAPFPPSLENALLERVASQHVGALEPFTEAGFAAHCSAWPQLRASIEMAADKPFHLVAHEGKALLMVWPVVRDALLDTALSIDTDRARELTEAAFALGAVTNDAWFVNEVCKARPALRPSFASLRESARREAVDSRPMDVASDPAAVLGAVALAEPFEDVAAWGSDESEDVFLPYLPTGLADSLYQVDEHGVPRALRVLPDSSRAYRRRLAKELRRLAAARPEVSAEMRDWDDVSVILSFIEERRLAATVFWLAAANARAMDGPVLAPSLELALLRRERERHEGVVGGFDEAVLARHCREWRSIRPDVERAANRRWHELPRAGLDLLMVWPALRDELADPGMSMDSDRARDALEGVFALSSVTNSPFFINEICERRPEFCDAFMELEDRLLMEEGGGADEEDLEDAEEGERDDVDRREPQVRTRSAERRAPVGSPARAPTVGRGEADAAAARSPDVSPATATAPEQAAPAPGLAIGEPARAAQEPAAEAAAAPAVDPEAAVARVEPTERKLAVAKAPDVRPVVQVVSELGGVDTAAALHAAREEVLAWLIEKGVRGLPQQARLGVAFEIDASEGLPVTVEAHDHVWALRSDTPDSAVAGRLWRTEVILGTLDSRALVGVRLTVISPRAGVPVRWSVPRVVRRLVARPGLRDYGARLMDCPWRVETEADVTALVHLLEQPARSRRVFALSEDKQGRSLLDGDALARRLAGLAHVVSLSQDAAQLLTTRVGEGLGVFGRAMRTYAPGLVCGVGASAAHPLATHGWLTERFESPEEFIDLLERRAIEDSVRGDLEATLPGFSRVRHWASARRLEEARRDVATDADLLTLYVESNATLTNELRDRDATIERLRLEQLQLEEERDEAVRDSRELRGRIAFLEQALTARGIEETIEYPSRYEDVEEWVARHLADRLTLLSRAVRSLKKAVFENLPLLCDCLTLLAGPYRDMKRGDVTRAAFDEGCARLGVTLTQSGDFSASRYGNEYTVQYGKERRVLDLHLKRGTSRDPAKCLRLYFFYDDVRARVVVGHLPSHLTTHFS